MRYVVPISGAEHLFHATDKGFDQARELAIASKSQVILEDGESREIIFDDKTTYKIPSKVVDLPRAI